jgi:hypothetical protein
MEAQPEVYCDGGKTRLNVANDLCNTLNSLSGLGIGNSEAATLADRGNRLSAYPSNDLELGMIQQVTGLEGIRRYS